MIETRGIGKNYSGAEDAALSDVSAEFGNSGLVAICGPAACGKTTLLNILGGIERPDSGELLATSKVLFHEAEDGRRQGNAYERADETGSKTQCSCGTAPRSRTSSWR